MKLCTGIKPFCFTGFPDEEGTEIKTPLGEASSKSNRFTGFPDEEGTEIAGVADGTYDLRTIASQDSPMRRGLKYSAAVRGHDKHHASQDSPMRRGLKFE